MEVVYLTYFSQQRELILRLGLDKAVHVFHWRIVALSQIKQAGTLNLGKSLLFSSPHSYKRSGHQSDCMSELVKGMPKSKEGALDPKFLPRR